MSSNRYDLVVIGSGPAGEKGAAQAAYFGKKVALVEKAEHLGGAGINTGTVPSKTLRETALYFSGLRQRGLYGIDYSLRAGLTVRDLMHRKQAVVAEERELIQRNLDRHGIELVRGFASLVDEHTVRVNLHDGEQRDLSAQVILLAPGSRPRRPSEIPFELPSVFDSDEILEMDRIPDSMVIVGGGVIGSEYGCVFTALGVDVALIDSKERLLPFLDSEIVTRLQSKLESLGLRFHFEQRARQIEAGREGVRLTLTDGGVVEAETALMAVGRESNVEGLGLERVGVELAERGRIKVNEKYQTTVPTIFAAGDVIGFPALAATSMEQARVAMVHAFGLQYKEQVSPILPLAIYTIPEISTVGLSEQACIDQGADYLVGRSYFERNPRGLIIGDSAGMLKLVFAAEDKRLLGVHLIGEQASELVHIGAHVMAEGGAIDAFIQAVYNYPSLADSYKYAAYDGLDHHRRWQEARSKST